jgi:hypothetical protein
LHDRTGVTLVSGVLILVLDLALDDLALDLCHRPGVVPPAFSLSALPSLLFSRVFL